MPWRVRRSVYVAGTPRSEKEEMTRLQSRESGLLDQEISNGPRRANARGTSMVAGGGISVRSWPR